MTPLYRYFSDENHVRSFMERGLLWLRTLAYYRAFEDEEARGDPDDAKLRFKPAEGLTITKSTGEVLTARAAFRSSVKENEMYVYCMSWTRSETIAQRFKSPFCVEIRNPIKLLALTSGRIKLRTALHRDRVYAQRVDYRSVDKAPGVDWALPERLAFIKPEGWAWQDEYRFVVGKKGAFAVENVDLALEFGDQPEPPKVDSEPLILKLGDLSGFTVPCHF
jgi:hypothetical protein